MKLRRLSRSTAESAEYEGVHEGRRVRITRLTDPNADGGHPETRWDGFVWEDGLGWSLVAELHGSMAAAVHETKRWIDRSSTNTTLT